MLRNAYVLYICNGMKWDKSIADFVKWSFEYCMWVKMSLFYEKAADGFQEEGFGKQPLNSLQLLDMLPDKFERGDFVAACKKTALRTPPKMMLYRMQRTGLLIKLDEQTFAKV